MTTTTRTRVVCDEHGQTSPCGGCAGDHAAGVHTPDNRREASCGRCTPPRLHPPSADWPALAANDTDYLEEDG